MPIADILRHREVLYGYSLSGTETNIDKRVYHAHYLTVGLFDRVEFGIDNDFEGSTVSNGKLLLWESPDEGRKALSIGVRNYRSTSSNEPYLVGRWDRSNVRCHFGVIKNDRYRAMAGLDFPIGEMTGAIDHISGAGSVTWLGLTVPIRQVDGLHVIFSGGVPTRRSDGYRYCVSVEYGTRF